MRKTLLVLIISTLTMVPVVADDWTPPAATELADLLADAGEMPLNQLTTADLTYALNLASLAQQQDAYVDRAARLSLMGPGLGQYAIGERTRAAAFAISEVALRAIFVSTAYVLLPPQVKVANLNYLQSPFEDIETAWKERAPGEFISSLSVMVAGSILISAVRGAASRDARLAARNAVDEGRVEFAPLPLYTPLSFMHCPMSPGSP